MTRRLDLDDDDVLVALRRACEDERGGWATATAAALHIEEITPPSMGLILTRLVREGAVEFWQPLAGAARQPLTLYRSEL